MERRVSLAFLLALLGCSDDLVGPDAGPDAGSEDAITLPDGGAPGDTGGRIDSGLEDTGGFFDPDVIFEGQRTLAGLRTYLLMMGTFTSTLPPAIFVHDGPSISHEYLLPHMKALLPGRLLVFYDLRGTGQTSLSSGGTSTVTAAKYAEDLGNVVTFLGEYADNGTVDLLGHGFGAAVAALWTASNNARVGRLILTTPYPSNIFDLAEFREEEQARLSSTEREQELDLRTSPECRGNPSRCFLEIFGIYLPHAMCPENRAAAAELVILTADPLPLFYTENGLRNDEYDWAPLFGMITADTTIISGSCDTVRPNVAETYATLINGAVHHILPDSGHYPLVEVPGPYFALLKAALHRP